jgi:hypothetical protein
MLLLLVTRCIAPDGWYCVMCCTHTIRAYLVHTYEVGLRICVCMHVRSMYVPGSWAARGLYPSIKQLHVLPPSPIFAIPSQANLV